MDETPTPAGWLDPLRRIGRSLQGLLRSRMELFTVEWQEEKLRLISLLVWVGLALALGIAGITVGIAALALWLWLTTGFSGVIVLVLLAVLTSAGILVAVRNSIQKSPMPFAGTVKEFRKDAECFTKN